MVCTLDVGLLPVCGLGRAEMVFLASLIHAVGRGWRSDRASDATSRLVTELRRLLCRSVMSISAPLPTMMRTDSIGSITCFSVSWSLDSITHEPVLIANRRFILSNIWLIDWLIDCQFNSPSCSSCQDSVRPASRRVFVLTQRNATRLSCDANIYAVAKCVYFDITLPSLQLIRFSFCSVNAYNQPKLCSTRFH